MMQLRCTTVVAALGSVLCGTALGQVGPNLELGSPTVNGSLKVHQGATETDASVNILTDIPGTTIATLGKTNNGGLLTAREMSGALAAEIGRGATLFGLPAAGGMMKLYMNGGAPVFTVQPGIDMFADDGSAAVLRMRKMVCNPFCSTPTMVVLDAAEADGGALFTLSDGSFTTVRLDAKDANNAGFFSLSDGAQATVELRADTSANAGGINLRSSTGQLNFELRGKYSSTNNGAWMTLNDNGAGRVAIAARSNVSNAGQIDVNNYNSVNTIEMRGAFGSTTPAAWIAIKDNGNERITLAGRNGNTGLGGLVDVKNNSGVTTIRLIGDDGCNGSGRIETSVLKITGGCDLAEPFDVAGAGIKPGLVVSIDPTNPGKLAVSERPYDAAVAGIISGAGGVNPGMVMSQSGTFDDAAQHVALTGRVYCWCDASYGPIVPGDRLTTSATPGHAMKVSDRGRADGAVLGKAMSGLESGQGLVLALVQPQ